jgi:hypothetical protein
MTVIIANVPADVVPILRDQLENFGCTVKFHTPSSGTLESPAGALRFEHKEESLTVELIDNRGHFPKMMIVGGIRQMVQEAIEIFNRRAQSMTTCGPNRRIILSTPAGDRFT